MSSALTPANPGGPSPVQFTADLVAITSGMMSFSFHALQRLSQAGIDGMTYTVGYYVGKNLKYSDMGLQRFYDALTTAPAHAGYKEVVWFGFGIKSPLQILAENEPGCKFAALCACLTEVYSANMTAQIMIAFIRMTCEKLTEQQPPIPSLVQMYNLVERCGGIVSTTNFPLWAEQYMSFDKESVVGQHAWPHGILKTRSTRGVANASHIAEALYTLNELAHGTYRKLTFVGGADAALMAAIGAWLYDLKVAIYTDEKQEEDHLWYRNHSDDKEPQLTVLYSREDQTSSSLIQGKTIYLKDATRLFKTSAEIQPSHDRVVSGRVPWGEALYRTFGVEVRKLLQRHVTLGRALGSTARIYAAIAEAEPDVPPEYLSRCEAYFEASYGLDFINFARERFPELKQKGLEKEMINAAQASSYSDAKDVLERSLIELADSCRCKTCFNGVVPPDDVSQANRSMPPRCYVAITCAIVRLVRGLSGVDPIANLHPSRKGLEYIYRAQQTRVSHSLKSGRKGGPDCIPCILENSIPTQHNMEMSLLRFAQIIFAGGPFMKNSGENEDQGASAVAENGICCYYNILNDPMQRNPIQLCRVRVIPGNIQYDDRIFHKIREMTTGLYAAGSQTIKGKVRPDVCVTKKTVKIAEYCYGCKLDFVAVENVAADRRAALEVSYLIHNESDLVTQFGPARVVKGLSHSLGQVTCPGNGCPMSLSIASDLEKLLLPQDEHPNRPQQFKIAGSEVTVFRSDPLVRLLVVYTCFKPIVQTGECIACCVQSGCNNGWREFAIVLSHSPV